jgi:hypothetical protein
MKRLQLIGPTLLIALLLTAAFGLVGCSDDDPVTPNDETQLTAEDVAHQAGFLAYSIVNVLPTLSNKAIPELETIPGFDGDFWLERDPEDRVYTDGDHMLSWSPAGFNITVTCEFDITSIGGLANGDGTLTAGDLVIDFDIEDVTVVANGYPTAGQIIVSSSGYVATIVFNGGTATVTIGGNSWTIDLSDGTIVT